MATRNMERGEKSRTSPSPWLSSFSRLSGIWPTSHRNTEPRLHPQSGHHRSQHDHDGNQNKDRAKSSDKHRDGGRCNESVSITLQDVDHRHGPFYLSVKRGSEVVRLESWVKERCRSLDRSASSTVRVRFYADARELGQHDLVALNPSVWFRLVTPHDNDGWKFTDSNDGDKALEAGLADDMAQCVEAGNTVGQLRKLVAEHRGIDDPNRIVIRVRDGARAGPLHGNMWELRRVRSWFCRWLSVAVGPPRSYIILEGPWGEYLFHPSEQPRVGGAVPAREVKRIMEARLFNSVGRLHTGKLKLKWSHIALASRPSRLGDDALISYGTRVRFDLPCYLEDVLASQESWLLHASETCAVCTDNKKPTDFPTRITSGCKHKGTTCRDCLGQWIRSSLDTLTWDRLQCPECREPLKFDDVKRYASKPDFDRYDALATRAALESIPDFKWCLSTSCESGQIHDRNCTKFKCVVCKAKHCVRHNVPWHTGETCDGYDRRNRRRRKDDKASEEVIKKTSKACPECKQAVHKWIGCNHITCVCGHEWCYICLAPFRRNQHGFLYCRHKLDCTEIDPLADLVDPEGRPGRPEIIRNPNARVAALRAAVRPRPLAQDRRDERAPQELMVWLDQLHEELLLPAGDIIMPDHPRQRNDEPRHRAHLLRMQNLLDEELNRAGIGRHGIHPLQAHAGAWARVWMRLENDGAGTGAMVADPAAAHNRHMPLPHWVPPRHRADDWN